MKNAEQFIEEQLEKLGVSKTCRAWTEIHERALIASAVLGKRDLKKLIKELCQAYPEEMFG